MFDFLKRFKKKKVTNVVMISGNNSSDGRIACGLGEGKAGRRHAQHGLLRAR